MAGKRFKIEETPGMHTTQGVPRNQANVEAEKGETMLTKDNVSNQKILVGIGGKKHSEGGTPLGVPEGTAIYSDSLKVKDPVILKFFGESGKKPKTFAQISKKYDVTKSQEELKDESIDKIRTESLKKNLENSAFKLSALFTIQEFHEKKGAPGEHSKHFEPFLERIGLDYEQIFGASGEQEQVQQVEGASPEGNPEFRYGSEVRFRTLPKAAKGDEIKRAPPYDESQAYTEEGIERLNKYMKIYGLPLIDKDAPPSAVKSRMREVQLKAIETNPDLIFDFMTTDVGETTTKSHRPNDKLQSIMEGHKSKYKPSGEDGTYTNEDLRLMLKDGTLNAANVADAYEDGKWWYRMVNSDITQISQKEMDKLTATDAYKNAPEQDGLKYIHQGDGYYKAYKTIDGKVVEVEADPAVVDELYKWDIEPLEVTPETERNMDFLWSNKRALKQAKKNKRNIQYLKPMTAVPETYYADQAYYSPDNVINQIQSMVNTQGTKQAMFAPQQQQTANFLAGQQFDMMGKVIGQYEDKNVQAYNREQMANTQIANRSAERLANAITGHHDKTTALKQQYSNSMIAADTNIAENEIAMWQERADRLNLEATIGEQFAKDPNTGIHEFIKGKDFGPTMGGQKTVADTYNDLANSLPPGTDESVIAKLAMAQHSGKYDVQQIPYPESTT